MLGFYVAERQEKTLFFNLYFNLLLVAAMAISGGVIIGVVGAAEIANLLFWEALDSEEWSSWLHPRETFLTVILPWPIIIYLTVVRFLAYIDLRTRREGWEIELDLRRAARRLDPMAGA
jgi:hypothetical protein